MRLLMRNWTVAVVASLSVAACAGGPAEQPGEQPRPQADAGATPEAAPSAAAERPLPLSRQDIVDTFTEHGMPGEAFETVQLDDGREVLTASYPQASGRQVLWVGVFGGETPHTLRMDLFPSEAQPEEAVAVGETIDALVMDLFPDEPDTANWAEEAGGRAWQEAAKLPKQEGGSQQVPILETERDGIWLAALGVPPDVLSYVFTTHQACRPSKTAATFYQGYSGCR